MSIEETVDGIPVRVENETVFRHEGKIIVVIKCGKAEDGKQNYKALNGAGQTLSFGTLPLEICLNNASLYVDLGPGKEPTGKGYSIDVKVLKLNTQSVWGSVEEGKGKK